MAWGSRYVITSSMLSASLVVALLVTVYPTFLQAAADAIFGHLIKNPDQRVYALAGLIIGVMVTVAGLAESSIRGDEAAKYSIAKG